jgi:hypothetical protein
MDTPVLFIIFNRPHYTKKVFAQIRKVKPKQLFIAADGPRLGNLDDAELCLKTRKIIEKIDWDCNVKTLFRDENLGCAKSVSGAISWFFEHVEEGIILEDDCVPDLSFFPFCALMLERYRNTEGVMQISGLNHLLNTHIKTNDTYYYSALNIIWCWATWRRAWQKFEPELGSIELIKSELNKRIVHEEHVDYMIDRYYDVSNKKVNSWAIVWNYHYTLNKGVCICPIVNLVHNIGYEGTHFQHKSWIQNMRIAPFKVNAIKYNDNIEINKEYDKISLQNIITNKNTFLNRLYNKFFNFKRRYLS